MISLVPPVPMLTQLDLWFDEEIRRAADTMSVDSWLLAHVKNPTLRVYRWPPESGSFGYFGKWSDARDFSPDLQWIRRFTGGGIVDHSNDWTYTLVIPTSEPLASLRGGESYRVIHGILAETLRAEGIDATLCDESFRTHHLACFHNPVSHDIVDSSGQKLAGAGQRRSRHALLHQGSVLIPTDFAQSMLRSENFAQRFSRKVSIISPAIPPSWIEQESSARFQSTSWLHLR